MIRFLAGAASCFLLLTGAFLLWQGRAEKSPLPPAPPPRPVNMAAYSTNLTAPEASPKSREEKRFSRADKKRMGRSSPRNCSARDARPSPSSTLMATARCRSTNGP